VQINSVPLDKFLVVFRLKEMVMLENCFSSVIGKVMYNICVYFPEKRSFDHRSCISTQIFCIETRPNRILFGLKWMNSFEVMFNIYRVDQTFSHKFINGITKVFELET
jgi:hypothetical protein